MLDLEPEDDAQLLARALGLDRRVVAPLASTLDALGGLHALWNAGSEGLADSLDPDAAARLEAVLAVAGRLVAPPRMAHRIETVADVAAYFQPRLALSATESFWTLMLDARARVLGASRIAEGTLTACLVHPREVFAPALRVRAANIVVVHNHPSGDPEPSDEDELLTDRLSDAGVILGIPLVDHVIVARGGFRSVSTPRFTLARGGLRRGAAAG
ncbi:JAB domain-containing protein [Myxococcota bacterium]|nr:JAB domain-containing protein [Myxococcota bacterium]